MFLPALHSAPSLTADHVTLGSSSAHPFRLSLQKSRYRTAMLALLSSPLLPSSCISYIVLDNTPVNYSRVSVPLYSILDFPFQPKSGVVSVHWICTFRYFPACGAALRSEARLYPSRSRWRCSVTAMLTINLQPLLAPSQASYVAHEALIPWPRRALLCVHRRRSPTFSSSAPMPCPLTLLFLLFINIPLLHLDTSYCLGGTARTSTLPRGPS